MATLDFCDLQDQYGQPIDFVDPQRPEQEFRVVSLDHFTRLERLCDSFRGDLADSILGAGHPATIFFGCSLYLRDLAFFSPFTVYHKPVVGHDLLK